MFSRYKFANAYTRDCIKYLHVFQWYIMSAFIRFKFQLFINPFFMKKFYSLIVATAIAVGANAEDFVLYQGTPSAVPVSEKVLTPAVFGNAAAIAPEVKTSPSRAASISEFEGSFDWSYYAPLGDGSYVDGTLDFAAVDGQDNQISVTGILNNISIIGTVDLAANTITFRTQDLGQLNATGIGYVNTKLSFCEIQSGKIVDYNGDLVFTLTENGYSVPRNLLFGISAHNLTTGDRMGWFSLCAYNEITAQAPDPNWEDAGVAVFSDGILTETYSKSETPITTKCTVQINVEDHNLIRLKKAFPYDSKSTLTLDLTDRQNIHIPYQNIGVKDEVDGDVYLVSISALGDNSDPITMEGNVISISSGACKIRWPEAPADSEYETNSNAYYNTGTMSSTITLPDEVVGIRDVFTDTTSENAPVEYFNLQGMKVTNPVGGQIYIVRQGKDVKKVIVR